MLVKIVYTKKHTKRRKIIEKILDIPEDKFGCKDYITEHYGIPWKRNFRMERIIDDMQKVQY